MTISKKVKQGATAKTYHHGDLRRALIDVAVQLIERKGLEAVSVREVAKFAGVSPGAPFRHFANRNALLTAVAEVAMDHLMEAIGAAIAEANGDDPLQQFRAIGVGFLRWAIGNPTHFQVISNRAVIDFEGSTLRLRNDSIRSMMRRQLNAALDAKLLRDVDIEKTLVAARAMGYGLARMRVDGQFASWELNDDQALSQCIAIIDQFFALLRI